MTFEDFTKLSREDICYVLDNPSSFSLVTRMMIKNNQDDISRYMNFNKDKNSVTLFNDTLNIYKQANDILMKIYGVNSASIEYKNLVKVSNMIPNLVSDNLSSIRDMIVAFFLAVVPVQKSMQSPVNLNEYIEFMITKVFVYKIYAYEIECKLNNKSNDLVLGTSGYLPFQFLMLAKNGSSIEYVVMSLYLIYKALDCQSLNNFDNMVQSMCIYHVKNYDMVKDLLIRLCNGSLQITEFIDKINDNEFIDISEKHKFNKFITDNYNKRQQSNILKQGVLCLGDNIFGPEEDINYLYIQMDKLNAEEVGNYIPEGSHITFNIPKNHIGYLIIREKVKMCKVMLNDTTVRTLINYHDTNYVLFEIAGKNSLYGLSFPEEYDGTRKLIAFNISDALEYDITQ